MGGLVPVQDAIFLLAEAREKPMHVGGLQLFTQPEDAEPDIVGRFHRDALERGEVRSALRRHPTRVAAVGPWRWEDDEHLDLEYHVRHSALPNPGRIRELLALVGRLHGSLLDRTRPLWEAHLIEGLSDGRFALYTKVHHALVDGIAAIRMLESALSEDPDETGMSPPWAPRQRPGAGSPNGGGGRSLPAQAVGLASDGVRAVTGAARGAVRSITRAFRDEAAALPFQAPASMFNVPISGARRFAADSWDLERLRHVAKATDATVNDVVMAMCGGALRAYLVEMDALPDAPLVAMVPVSLRRDGDGVDGGGNAVGLVLCNLATHVADAADRFERTRTSMDRGKLALEGLSPEAVMLLSAASFAPLGLGPLFRFEPLRRPPFNIVISNVPGPTQPLYWNRARMDEMYPVSIPYDGQALNITVNSYTGSLGVGLTGCRRSVPHLQRLLDHLDTSLVDLEHATGVA